MKKRKQIKNFIWSELNYSFGSLKTWGTIGNYYLYPNPSIVNDVRKKIMCLDISGSVLDHTVYKIINNYEEEA